MSMQCCCCNSCFCYSHFCHLITKQIKLINNSQSVTNNDVKITLKSLSILSAFEKKYQVHVLILKFVETHKGKIIKPSDLTKSVVSGTLSCAISSSKLAHSQIKLISMLATFIHFSFDSIVHQTIQTSNHPSNFVRGNIPTISPHYLLHHPTPARSLKKNAQFSILPLNMPKTRRPQSHRYLRHSTLSCCLDAIDSATNKYLSITPCIPTKTN
jgi:hypothetical protein